ncbi:hypothetical protein BDR03DRAFT_968181 [Suillus americanus]|nr:hypothetical protein BDR03DRAFT_968181 [Suillus americanus]
MILTFIYASYCASNHHTRESCTHTSSHHIQPPQRPINYSKHAPPLSSNQVTSSVHNYHLLLVPYTLRNAIHPGAVSCMGGGDVIIGLFVHTPFQL